MAVNLANVNLTIQLFKVVTNVRVAQMISDDDDIVARYFVPNPPKEPDPVPVL